MTEAEKFVYNFKKKDFFLRAWKGAKQLDIIESASALLALSLKKLLL